MNTHNQTQKPTISTLLFYKIYMKILCKNSLYAQSSSRETLSVFVYLRWWYSKIEARYTIWCRYFPSLPPSSVPFEANILYKWNFIIIYQCVALLSTYIAKRRSQLVYTHMALHHLVYLMCIILYQARIETSTNQLFRFHVCVCVCMCYVPLYTCRLCGMRVFFCLFHKGSLRPYVRYMQTHRNTKFPLF